MTAILDTTTGKPAEWLSSTDGLLNVISATQLEKLFSQGRVFNGSYIFIDLSSSSFVDILMLTGSVVPLIGIGIAPLGDFYGAVYEAPTVTGNGTPLVSHNFNRPLSDQFPTPVTQVFLAPTVTDNGDLLDEGLILGGERKDAVATSGERVGVEKANTYYLFRFQNQSGQSARGTIGWTIGE